MRASTDSSSDSDSVTRWCTHSSATESYSFFFEPSRWTRSRVTTLWSEIDARISAAAAAKNGDAAAQSRFVRRVPRSADVFRPTCYKHTDLTVILQTRLPRLE